MSKMMQHQHKAIIQGVTLAAAVLLAPQFASGKTLFLAHYDESVDADFAVGTAEARPVKGYQRAGIVTAGHWGGAVDLTDRNRTCTYRALKNLNPRRGTVDFRFAIDEDRPTPAPAMYHPLFGWYNMPKQPGDGKRETAFELYFQGRALTFDIYAPKSAPASGSIDAVVGKWYHLEINWDCTGGDGASEYNVYLDGRSVIRATDRLSLKEAGGLLHLGIWDYGFGHQLKGRIDELRITDQIEHRASFTPPAQAYPIPGTRNGVKLAYKQTMQSLGALKTEIRWLESAAKEQPPQISKKIRDNRAVMLNAASSMAKIRALLPAAKARCPELQKEIDIAADAIKAARHDVARATGLLYARIPRMHNETVVNLAYLRDEIEGLRRALHYCRDLADPAPAGAAAARAGETVAGVSKILGTVSDGFFRMFEDSPGARADPVAALQVFSANRDKARIMQALSQQVSEAAATVKRARDTVAAELQGLRSDPALVAQFPAFRRFNPPAPGPVAVEPDGTLKRVIFGGAHGRTDTISVLNFDTLRETGVSVTWPKQAEFATKRSAVTIAQWEEYRIPLSDKIFLYAVGDNMYRPEWFADVYGENPDYYFVAGGGYIGTGGFDYRHPLPRKLIMQYLEEAARINGQEPYTFIYKGPWEAHPYRGTSVDVPGKRTAAFQEHGFSKVAVKAFRGYLQAKHGTIANLNRAWRSNYGSFGAIQPPAPLIRAFIVTRDDRGQDVYSMFLPNKRLPGAATTALTYEFERCRKDLYADYLADCRAAIKRGDPKHPLASSTSGGIMGEILINSLDDLLMPERCVDMWGKHPSGGYGWADSPYMYGLNRYFNKTLVALEYYGWAQEEIGENFWPTFKAAPGATVETVFNAGRRDVWHEYSWDRRMLLFYWTQKIVQMRNGLNEINSPLLREWSGLIAATKRRVIEVNDILINVPIIKPRIAVVHPGVSIINAYPTNACAKVTRDILDRLLAKQYHFGIVPEAFILNGRDRLENYDVVILPYAQYFKDGFDQRLTDWVRDGGSLIAAGPFGLYNQYGAELEHGAAAVFAGTAFVYPPPDDYELSWEWQARRNGESVARDYFANNFGAGKVLMTLDGRGFGRRGTASAEAHVGTEIGAEISGTGADSGTTKKRDDRGRALKLDNDEELPPAVRKLYRLLDMSTARRAHVASGNVEMVLRQKDEAGPLYVSLLNWDYTAALSTEVVVRGEYATVTDLSIDGGFPVPAAVANGNTRLPIVLGPGEGLMLRLQ